MSHLFLTLCVVLCLAAPEFAFAKSSVELKTHSKISRGQDAVFKAKILDPQLRKLRLRYKDSQSRDFKWVDYEKGADGDLSASIPASEIEGSLIHYYIVAQRKDGSVENLYGSPTAPHQIIVDRRSGDPITHPVSAFRKGRSPARGFLQERFGDDEISEQLVVYSATDEHSFVSKVHKWGKISNRVGEERIAQMGFITLSEALRAFPIIDFSDTSAPIFSGLSARGRLKLKIDGLEVYDDFDGSSFWELDSVGIGGLAILDRSHEVMGVTGGYFGTIDVTSPKKSQFIGRIGGATDGDMLAGFNAGKRVGPFFNHWTLAAGHFDEGYRIASLMSSDYWWRRAQRPLATLQLHTYAEVPDRDSAAYRVAWDGRLSFDFPASPRWNPVVALNFGQTFHRDYRLLRLGLNFANELILAENHLLGVNVGATFVGLSRSGNQPSLIRRCEILELNSSGLIECRIAGTFTVRERWQLFDKAALISGIEIAAATSEKNDVKSLLHPSALFEISPHPLVDVNVGYSSSLRWSTFLEKQKALDIPAPEKLRVASAGVSLKLPSEHAFVLVDLQGRSMWLVDADPAQVFGVTAGLTAKLAASHQVFLGTEFHSSDLLTPQFKAVLGARINLMKWGSAYFEIQEPSRFHMFYQTRPLFEHFILEGRVDRQSSSGSFHFFADLKFFV